MRLKEIAHFDFGNSPPWLLNGRLLSSKEKRQHTQFSAAAAIVFFFKARVRFTELQQIQNQNQIGKTLEARFGWICVDRPLGKLKRDASDGYQQRRLTLGDT